MPWYDFIPAFNKYQFNSVEPDGSETQETPMDDPFEILKDCNLKLDRLRTEDYRFVAWLIYSTQHNCFIAGVDTYSNDDQNLMVVIYKSAEPSPIDALSTVYSQVRKWYGEGFIPLDAPLSFE